MYLVSIHFGKPKLQSWKYPLPGNKVIITIKRTVRSTLSIEKFCGGMKNKINLEFKRLPQVRCCKCIINCYFPFIFFAIIHTSIFLVIA
ncbi:MAG: hypothetical protein ABIN89_25545 [Chitinophagaceae bacterium]